MPGISASQQAFLPLIKTFLSFKLWTKKSIRSELSNLEPFQARTTSLFFKFMIFMNMYIFSDLVHHSHSWNIEKHIYILFQVTLSTIAMHSLPDLVSTQTKGMWISTVHLMHILCKPDSINDLFFKLKY